MSHADIVLPLLSSNKQTKNEIAARCDLTPTQAKNALDRLFLQGKCERGWRNNNEREYWV